MYDDRPALRDAADPSGRLFDHDQACFADEVVIDFPSVVPLVARMRQAFLEPDAVATPVWADVSVTVDEASRGCRKPVVVSLAWVCRECGGRGETWDERCATCGGSGTSTTVEAIPISVPAGVRDGTSLALAVAVPGVRPTLVRVRVSIA